MRATPGASRPRGGRRMGRCASRWCAPSRPRTPGDPPTPLVSSPTCWRRSTAAARTRAPPPMRSRVLHVPDDARAGARADVRRRRCRHARPPVSARSRRPRAAAPGWRPWSRPAPSRRRFAPPPPGPRAATTTPTMRSPRPRPRTTARWARTRARRWRWARHRATGAWTAARLAATDGSDVVGRWVTVTAAGGVVVWAKTDAEGAIRVHGLPAGAAVLRAPDSDASPLCNRPRHDPPRSPAADRRPRRRRRGWPPGRGRRRRGRTPRPARRPARRSRAPAAPR